MMRNKRSLLDEVERRPAETLQEKPQPVRPERRTDRRSIPHGRGNGAPHGGGAP